MTPKPKGGKRPGAGRKPTYTQPTTRITRVIPTAWIADIDQWLLDKRVKGEVG